MTMNATIIGRSFGDPGVEAGAVGDDGFNVELTSGPAGETPRASEFTSDVVEGDFASVPVKNRRPFKVYLAGGLLVGLVLAGGAAYIASTLKMPKATDIDFGALKSESPIKVAVAAPAAASPATIPSDAGPAVAAPAIGVAGEAPAIAPIVAAVPAAVPAVALAAPAGQGAVVQPQGPVPQMATSSAVAPSPTLLATQAPAPVAPKPTAVAPTPAAKPSTPPAAKSPIAPARPAVKVIAKPLVAKPASIVRPTPLAARQLPAKPVAAAKPLSDPRATVAATPTDANPLGADVRPLVTVTAEQIGMRAMSADAISLATAAGIQRYKVGDYLPSGDRVMHIDSPGSTLVTDKKIIRVLN